MKLWQKNTTSTKEVEQFTIGRDPEFDLVLAPFDILGSLAHATMLESIGLLTKEELATLKKGLKEIYEEIEAGTFKIDPGVEDVHSQVEFLLTERYGDVGKKLHSGRSRNDQVAVDLKLFYRSEIQQVLEATKLLFDLLINLAEKHKNDLMPGYTHTQLAMPSSFGLWFSSLAESLAEDIELWQAAYNQADRNPLGSAAGFGSSFPLNRTMTTELLGFKEMHYNVINAQNNRGKTEKVIAFAMAGMAGTLNRLADDTIIFMNQHFGFVKFPDNLTTGSSIMPHKKNPDVFELIRAKCNQIQSGPQNIMMQMTNTTTGYHRDLQLLKETTFPDFEKLRDCIEITRFMLENVEVKSGLLKDSFYKHLFSVEEVNRLVLEGMPFRDAYKKVGLDIESDNFKPEHSVNHTHEGSIGQLCLDKIQEKMDKALAAFSFGHIENQYQKLLEK
ncbi:argininosuccinate lyase [Echinicola jeungdonensis]|uniref:Argininosuccinate lyase n=1 Tax=Echinicola jeungdonensis TaxID=709343 RepID=A0ABV5J0M5_9BACT|nr:argininosuccinate lyase [Echinicola jeungdonensis]MDN3667816.1 argininosuccinate lyase [Echinicola jeungdonensis]